MPLAYPAARLAHFRFRLGCLAGETDIIARRGRVLAAIEVESRADYDAGAAAVWRASTPHPPRHRNVPGDAPRARPLALRFDVIGV